MDLMKLKKAGWQTEIYKELKPQILEALNLRKLKETKNFEFKGPLTSFDQTKFHDTTGNNWAKITNVEQMVQQGKHPLWDYFSKFDGPVPKEFDKHFSKSYTGSQQNIQKQRYKKASWDDFKSYMKSNYDYGSYLLKHKFYVGKAGLQLDLPFTQLAVHDYNKFSPKRWDLYRQWFATEQGRSGEKDPALYKKFRRVADQHIASVPYGHHWYRNKTPIEKVPVEYRLESLADWYGVYAANHPDHSSFKDWYKKYRYRLPLDPVAKQIADQKLVYGL